MTGKALRSWSRDRGAAAVEMAIVVPVLVTLVIGIIDLSRIMNAELQLSQAAREGVRIAALAASSSSYDATFVQTRARAAAPAPAFTPQTATVTSALCNSSSLPTQVATVTVSVPFQGIIYSPPGATLSQTAVMRCGG